MRNRNRSILYAAFIISILILSLLPVPVMAQDLDEAKSLNAQVVRLYQQGRFKEAISLADRDLAIIEKVLGPNHPDTAISLNNLAELYKALGDYQKAEPLYKRALGTWEKVLGPNHPDTAGSLNNLALLYYSLDDYQKAEPLYKRALTIREKALGPEHPYTAISLSSLAELYNTLGDYQKAEPLYKRSLGICERVLGPNHPDTAGSLNNLALLYYSLDDYQKAEPLYKRALTIREKALGPEHPYTAISLNNLAMLYLDSGRAPDAYAIFFKRNNPMGFGKYYLVVKDYPEAQKHWVRSLDISRKSGIPHFLITSYTGLALSYEGQGNYKKAKEHFQEAINIVEKQWQTLSPQAKKEFLSGKVRAGFTRMEPYEGMVRVILKERGTMGGTDSFSVAEHVKGRLFLEMLAARQLKGKTDQDEATLSKDRQFQQDIAVLRKRVEVVEGLKIKPPQEEINALKNELTQKEKEYDAFIEEVKLKGGELASLIAVDPLSPPKLQSLLDQNTSLLEYFTTKDALYAWLVTKDDIKVYEMGLKGKEVQVKVDTLLLPNISNKPRRPMPEMVYIPSSDTKETTAQEREENRRRFTKTGQDFYKDILSLIEKDVKTPNLIIVPHGVLHKVPFAALSDGKQYLIDKYSLSILPSASVMEYVVKKRKPSKNTILTLANPKTDYVPLGFAEKEGETVSKLFPTREVYTKDKATETLAKTKSSSFNVVHFASHGQFNERQPLQSGLLLAKDADNDGHLQVHEIFSLDLKNANLVTLSACETALSKIQGGDDLVGLSRGFIYAGTPSLLATLWEVDDQSTSILMEIFYKNWLKGMSKPEALRQAQLTLKKTPQYAHPYYWAAFEMIGDWQ